MKDYQLFIDGEWRDAHSGAWFDAINPFDGEVWCRIARADQRDVDDAVSAAQRAFDSDGWGTSLASERAALLRRAADILCRDAKRIAELEIRDIGKRIVESEPQIAGTADWLDYYAGLADKIEGSVIPLPRGDIFNYTLREPLGVVAAITPWNYPISMITRKLGPALAAGCTVVLKPAEATPMCAVEMMKIFEEAGVPPGVVNLVTASDPKPIGEVFTTHPAVAKLTFTGSTGVGKMLAASAAGHIKRVSMELGGHAPFIVCPDADPVHAAKGASLVKFLNTGQACISPNRFLVHESVYEPFVETLTARFNQLLQAGLVNGFASMGNEGLDDADSNPNND